MRTSGAIFLFLWPDVSQRLLSQVQDDFGLSCLIRPASVLLTQGGSRNTSLSQLLLSMAPVRRMHAPLPSQAFMSCCDSVQVLLRNCSDPSTREQLISSYDMLTSPTKMGERFHFFSLLHPSRFSKPVISTGLNLERTKSPASLPVAGFTELSFP